MKRSFYLIALMCCIVFAGCKKDDGGTNTGEDLSYLIKTYYRYENGGKIIKQTWTYDGYKVTGYKAYEDGKLYEEYKNYTYNGLNVSYDFYSYRNGDVNDVTVRHNEYEYLDNTYQRLKHTKYYYLDSQNTEIYETHILYDGKKKISSKNYTNGVLKRETLYSYDGLRCSYTVSYYYSPGVVSQERSYEILYLDETYLREKSRLYTRKQYDTDGSLLSTDTYYTVNDYLDKKPFGYHWYHNGNLGAVGRDYQYNGLNCYYFVDSYNSEGEVASTSLYEVEYLE